MSDPGIHTESSIASERAHCDICFDDISNNVSREFVPDMFACEICCTQFMVPQLLEAVEFEHKFPPKIGSDKLDPEPMKDLLPDGFQQKWDKMRFLSDTPYTSRVYCANRIRDTLELCSAFVCRKTITPGRTICARCGCVVCSKCGSVMDDDDDDDDDDDMRKAMLRRESKHVCLVQSHPGQYNSSRLARRIAGFQICPNKDCAMKVELLDGCNEVHCTNAACPIDSFCFLCGQKTEGNHFEQGKPCPRFGRRGNKNAQYDPSRPRQGNLRVMPNDEFASMALRSREYELYRRQTLKRHRAAFESSTYSLEQQLPEEERIKRRFQIDKLTEDIDYVNRIEDDMEAHRQTPLLFREAVHFAIHMAWVTTSLKELLLVNAYWKSLIKLAEENGRVPDVNLLKMSWWSVKLQHLWSSVDSSTDKIRREYPRLPSLIDEAVKVFEVIACAIRRAMIG